jgi:hypothetical protein
MPSTHFHGTSLKFFQLRSKPEKHVRKLVSLLASLQSTVYDLQLLESSAASPSKQMPCAMLMVTALADAHTALSQRHLSILEKVPCSECAVANAFLCLAVQALQPLTANSAPSLEALPTLHNGLKETLLACSKDICNRGLLMLELGHRLPPELQPAPERA